MLEKRFAIKDTLKCSALALAFFGLAMFIPVLSLLVCLVPAFIAVSTYRNSLKMGALGALIVVIGAFLMFGVGGIVFSVELTGLGLLLGELMRRKIEPPYVIILGAVFFVLMFIGGVFLSGQGSTQQVLDNMLFEYESILLESGDAFIASVGGTEYISALVALIRDIFPSFLLKCGIVIAFVNYYLTGYMLMKIYLKRQIPMFAEFTLPRQMFIGILCIGLMLLFMNYVGFIYYESLVTNTIMVFSLLFYIQGLACAYNFLMTRMKPFGRNLLMIALIIFIPAHGIVKMLGFFDVGFNLRRLNR